MLLQGELGKFSSVRPLDARHEDWTLVDVPVFVADGLCGGIRVEVVVVGLCLFPNVRCLFAGFDVPVAECGIYLGS